MFFRTWGRKTKYSVLQPFLLFLALGYSRSRFCIRSKWLISSCDKDSMRERALYAELAPVVPLLLLCAIGIDNRAWPVCSAV